MGDTVDRGAVMGQVRAGLVASLVGSSIVLFVYFTLLALIDGVDGVTVGYLFVAFGLAVASALRQPTPSADLAGAIGLAVVDGALWIYTIMRAFANSPAGQSEPVILAVLILAHLLLLVRSVYGLASGDTVSKACPAGGALLGLTYLISGPQAQTLAYLVFVASGTAAGFWLSRLRSGPRPLAWFALAMSAVSPWVIFNGPSELAAPIIASALLLLPLALTPFARAG